MKRVSLAISAGLIAASAGFAFAAPAAADYPPKEPVLSISGCSDVDRGVKVKVKNLDGETDVTFAYAPATGAAFFSLARAATSGTETTETKPNGSATVILPIDEAGTYAVTATGTANGEEWTGTTTATVVGSCDDTIGGIGGGTNGGSTGGIADTGADSALLLTAGVGALVVGGGAVMIARRRREGDAATA